MTWWRRALFPVRRVWIAVSVKVRKVAGRESGSGLLKLHSDVQTCGYEDVQVMWEMMLRRSEKGVALDPLPSSKRKHKMPLWRFATWSGRTASCGSLQPQANHN